MKVSKKIFIIFSMILLLVSPVTSLGKDIKWVLERPVIPVLVKKPANPVMKITLIRTDNQPYVIRQIDLDLLGSTNVADIVSVRSEEHTSELSHKVQSRMPSSA